MGEWFEPLEYYFLTRWRSEAGPAGIPDAVTKAIRPLGGEQFDVDLVHPVDREDDRIAFVMVTGDEVVLFHFEPPGTVTTSFLGSLIGGRYTETAETKEGASRVEGLFEHRRIGADGLRFILDPPQSAFRDMPDGRRAALERTDQLREKLREWSRKPLPRQPES